MQYKNLQELISHSRSSRQFFLSLPVSLQSNLHEYNEQIHSAAALREYASTLTRYNHAVETSKILF